MKLVFAHDHKLRRINGAYYTPGGLSDEILSKYLVYFDSVTVFCRSIKKQDSDSNLFRISDRRVSVSPISYDGSLIPTKIALKEMETEIASADGLIVKLHSVVAEFAIRFARKYHIPYLVECVGDPWDAYWNYSYKGKLAAPIMTLLTRREVSRAPFVLYVTKEYLERRYPSKGLWIGCSDVMLPPSNIEVLQKRISKIENNDKIKKIGTLAQVDVRYKGQEYVIEAIGILKKMGIRIEYELAGSGSQSFLRTIAKKNNVENQVHFLGVLPHSDVFAWLDTLDLYVQPSKQEGLPRALAEAISQACPAIGSNVGGISELIDKTCIFRSGNIADIVHLLRNANANFLKSNSRKNFLNAKNYDPRILGKKRMEFYRKFASKCENNLKQS